MRSAKNELSGEFVAKQLAEALKRTSHAERAVHERTADARADRVGARDERVAAAVQRQTLRARQSPSVN